jgi:hypothetical protein
LAVDADFVPNAGASALLQRAAADSSKVVLVVPIFTENGNHILPCVFEASFYYRVCVDRTYTSRYSYPTTKAELLRSLKVNLPRETNDFYRSRRLCPVLFSLPPNS